MSGICVHDVKFPENQEKIIIFFKVHYLTLTYLGGEFVTQQQITNLCISGCLSVPTGLTCTKDSTYQCLTTLRSQKPLAPEGPGLCVGCVYGEACSRHSSPSLFSAWLLTSPIKHPGTWWGGLLSLLHTRSRKLT